MSFEAALRIVLDEEGGLSDHAADPGGRTNLGITQKTLDRARADDPGLPGAVDFLTVGEARSIYRRLYWNPIRGDELPPGVAAILFDGAVNHGVPRASMILQETLGVVADGNIGPKTLRVLALNNPRDVIREIASRRAWAYMLLDRIDDTFGLGWARRLFRVYDAALIIQAGAR